MIPLGILATAGAGGVATGPAFDWIATANGTGSSGTITFNSSGVWANYKHLQIRFSARTSASSTLAVQLNGITSLTAYATHRLFGTGAAGQSSATTGSDRIYLQDFVAGSGATAGMYGVGVIDFLDINNANTNKTIRAFGGRIHNDTIGVRLSSGFVDATVALTSITLLSDNFDTSSQFSIYGIKG